MDWFTLYLLTVLPNLRDAAIPFLVMSFITALFAIPLYFISAAGMGDDYERNAKEATRYNNSAKRAMRWSLGVVLVSGSVATFVPTQNQLVFIVAGSTLIEAAQSDRVKGIADQSLSVVEKWLKDQTQKEAQ